MQHIIQKQTFSLSASTLKLMYKWEQHAQGMVNDVINPCIERCFDEVSTEGENMLIDHLEIDIGAVNNLTNRQIIDKVYQELSSQLQKQKYETGINEKKDELSNNQDKGRAYRKLNKHETAVACFVHFLIHGRLPWWVEPDQVKLQGEWMQELSTQEVKLIAQELSQNAYARARLVYQFNVKFISKLLRYYHPSLSTDVLLGWKWLEKLSPPAHVRLTYWMYWMGKCMEYDVEKTSFVQALKQWTKEAPEVKAHINTLLKNKSGFLDEQERKVILILKGIFLDMLEKQDSAQDNSRIPPIDDSLSIDPDVKNKKEKIEEDGASVQPLNGKSTEDTSSAESFFEGDNAISNGNERRGAQNIYPDEDAGQLYAEAAGLVLLHPFLSELFRTGEIWDERGWTSDMAQHQAVMLITWLAFGETNMLEYHLTIPKLLCGMPWEKPLNTTLTLNESQVQTGTELLEAVIKHWKALGNTSIDGLREGFLWREGKITKQEDGWHLLIEKKAQDILLNKLPWGISLVHLPWLGKHHIYVDWN